MSRVDSPRFFNHPNGKYDPSKELEATVALFTNRQAQAGFFKHHPQCVFVERYRFLKKAGIVVADDLPCPDFIEWKRGIGAKSIVLVFSSSFPNNPASVFGHTFIRFKREEKNSLLDYSASYAAFTEGEAQGLLYAIKGLVGGYKGGFSIAPYYMKVNQYNNSQNRDLYEYELNLSMEGVERIVNHLWELYSTAYFDYYFFDENCSYILAKVLELGNPDWNLSDINRWYYLPSDSIKHVTRIGGAVRKIHFRPSLKKQVIARLNKLDAGERALFFGVKEGDIALEEIKNSHVLDALIAYGNYKKRERKGAFSEQDHAFFRKLLLQRAQIEEKSVDFNVDENESDRPEFGHAPSQLSLGMGNINNTAVYRLNFKSGLHDLLSSDRGFEPFSQIEFLGGELQYSQEAQKVNISEVTFIDVVSLTPYTSFDPRFSWKIGVHYEQIHDLECDDCYKYDSDIGFGGSFYLGTTNAVFNILSGVFSEISEHFESSHRLGPFIECSIIGNLSKTYMFQIKQTVRANGLENFPKDYYLISSVGQSVTLGANWDVRLENRFVSRYKSSEVQTHIHELKLGYYF